MRGQERTFCKNSSICAAALREILRLRHIAPFEHSYVSVPVSVDDAPYVDELALAVVADCLKGNQIHMLR